MQFTVYENYTLEEIKGFKLQTTLLFVLIFDLWMVVCLLKF